LIGIVGYLQWQTLANTDRTLHAAQRPWIEFKTKLTDSMRWSGDELTVLAEMDLTNSGHSPAVDVRVYHTTLFDFGNKDPAQIQRQICNEWKKGERSGSDWGRTIFPNGEPISAAQLFSISKEEVENLKTGNLVFPQPYIFGCVTYVDPADQSQHETGFIYILRDIGRPVMPFALRAR
jgi:hypothetical protein